MSENTDTRPETCPFCGTKMVRDWGASYCPTCTPRTKEATVPTQCRPQKEDQERCAVESLMYALAGEHPSQAIYDAEARGQAEMVKSESLPVQTNFCTDADLEAMGIELGQPFEEDPIFRPAVLPDGWVRKATDHSMWSEVLDARGRKRLSIFYKAAFYDRSAHIGAEKRFNVLNGGSFRSRQPDYDRDNDARYGDEPGDRDYVVTDFGHGDVPVELFRVKVPDAPDTPLSRDDSPEREAEWRDFWKAEGDAGKAAEAWLDERYPDWRQPAAYWDDVE